MLARVAFVIYQVTMTPTADGAPGASMAQQLIDWLGQYALWASLGAILVGVITYGLGQRFGNGGYATGGRTLVVAGIFGAILTGLGPTIINLFYSAAQSG